MYVDCSQVICTFSKNIYDVQEGPSICFLAPIAAAAATDFHISSLARQE